MVGGNPTKAHHEEIEKKNKYWRKRRGEVSKVVVFTARHKQEEDGTKATFHDSIGKRCLKGSRGEKL